MSDDPYAPDASQFYYMMGIKLAFSAMSATSHVLISAVGVDPDIYARTAFPFPPGADPLEAW